MRISPAVFAVAVIAALVLGTASGQISSPYFQIAGGIEDRQAFVASGNFIPLGAYESDSAVVSGTPRPVTIILRDPAFAVGVRQVCADYIGSDAAYQNRFYVPGTAIDWCNKASCQDAGTLPLGTGLRSWTGPYAASACFDANVGQPVPFVFIADVLNEGGNGPHLVGNGSAIDGAHWGAFPYPFIHAGPGPAGSTMLVLGLADGNWAPGDDDHQDFVVRLTVRGVPAPATIPTLDSGGIALLSVLLAAGAVLAWRGRAG